MNNFKGVVLMHVGGILSLYWPFKMSNDEIAIKKTYKILKLCHNFRILVFPFLLENEMIKFMYDTYTYCQFNILLPGFMTK